jgi:hypothetical protein
MKGFPGGCYPPNSVALLLKAKDCVDRAINAVGSCAPGAVSSCARTDETTEIVLHYMRRLLQETEPDAEALRDVLPPHELLPHELPPHELPPHELPPHELPPRELPPHELPPRELAPRELTPRELPLPPSSLPLLPTRELAPRELPLFPPSALPLLVPRELPLFPPSALYTVRSGLPDGLRVWTLVEGNKAAVPVAGDLVDIHYDLSTGEKLLQSTRAIGKTFQFRLGGGSVFKGIDLAVARMCKGEIANVVLPTTMFVPSSLVPSVTLYCIVELVAIA